MSVAKVHFSPIPVALLHEKSYPRVGFPSVFLRAWEVPTIVPRCFRLLFWQQERIALGRWTGTISHEAGLLGAAGLPA
jgi:hypothetical protein